MTKSNLVKEEFVWGYGSGRRIHNVERGVATGVQSRKLSDHISTHTQEAKEMEVGGG